MDKKVKKHRQPGGGSTTGKQEGHEDKKNPYLSMKKYKGNNLYLIVDLNTQYWLDDNSLGIPNLLVLISQIMNTHLIKSIHNSVHVILMNSRDSQLIFPLKNEPEGNDQDRIDNIDYKEIQRRIERRVLDFMSNNLADNLPYSKLVSALTQTLCRVNKFQSELEKKILTQVETEHYFSSLLILQVSEIHSSTFNNLMSCIETAIKNKVSIYSFPLPQEQLAKSTQQYLMQLCSLTQGYFLEIKDKYKNSKNLKNPFDIMNFLSLLMLTSGDMIAPPDLAQGSHPAFRQAVNETLNFSVNCTCHNRPIESQIAFVCSNCLFLYCKNDEPCHLCDDRPQLLQQHH